MRRYADFIERITAHKGKRIIIWGGGINGRQIYKALSLAEIRVEYFVDSRPGKDVFPPDRLMEENKSECIVIVSPHHIPYILDIDKKLAEWGWVKDDNYINYITDDIIQSNVEVNYFDPFLGYSQIRDMEGFTIYGDGDSPNRIVLLGNCTSIPDKLGKIWVDYLHEHHSTKNYTLYNGACTGYFSSQELLKLIRDVLLLKPKILIVFNGVIDATNANRQPDYLFYTKFECNLLEEYIVGREEETRYKGMQQVPNKIAYGGRSSERNYECYVRNMRLMNAIAKEMDIHFLNFLQPSLYCNNYGLTDSEKAIFESFYKSGFIDSLYQTAHDFYENVRKSLKEEAWFYDMTSVFKGMKEGAYLDEIHYTMEGHQIIGDYICRVFEQFVVNDQLG